MYERDVVVARDHVAEGRQSFVDPAYASRVWQRVANVLQLLVGSRVWYQQPVPVSCRATKFECSRVAHFVQTPTRCFEKYRISLILPPHGNGQPMRLANPGYVRRTSNAASKSDCNHPINGTDCTVAGGHVPMSATPRFSPPNLCRFD